MVEAKKTTKKPIETTKKTPKNKKKHSTNTPTTIHSIPQKVEKKVTPELNCKMGSCSIKSIIAKLITLALVVIVLISFSMLVSLKKEIKMLSPILTEIHQWNVLNAGGQNNYQATKNLLHTSFFEEDMSARITQMEKMINGEFDENFFLEDIDNLVENTDNNNNLEY